MKNPLLRADNEEIKFSKLTAKQIQEATQQTILNVKTDLTRLMQTQTFTFDSVLGAWDRLHNRIYRVFNPIYLMAETHPDDDVRQEGRLAIQSFSELLNELSINEEFYNLTKKYTQTPEAKNLTTIQKKFLDDMLLNFKRNGFELTKEQREQLKKIKIEIDNLCLEFSKNIAEADHFIDISENEISGLPEDYLSERKTKNDTYRIDLSYPSYYPFMKFSNNEQLRKELLLKFNNRAFPANLTVLNQILQKRKALSELLGYKSYTDYATEDRMVKNPNTVWEFENNLSRSVAKKAASDYNELNKLKKEQTSSSESVRDWESAYYANQLKEKQFNIDDQEVKKYFELNQTIQGLFDVTQKMLGLKYEEVKKKSVWHEDVRQFLVFDSETRHHLGCFYLDLFPRKNKYGHAAMFPIVGGIKLSNDTYEKPIAALVCNFPKPNKNNPSLLFFSDVKTLFHEFGHLLHGMVTTSPISMYAGTNTVIDFVETPSQFFENLVYETDVLALFAKHYKTGEIMPQSLIDKLKAARTFGSGTQTEQQIFYGTYDFTIHSHSDSLTEENLTTLLKELKEKLTQFKFTDGDHFHASFGHLAGYGAGYYSYLWSKVYAQDIWSVFEKKGVFDTETGKKFRKIILEPGGSKDPLELVKEFLGREPNHEAFLRELGVN